ncbi:MAG: polysaccharide deacetylase family protein [Candidatus Scalindua sp.]|nr:polysaccharide deacetylase family protein [Candidatus Scalindua sp.]
MKNYYIILLAFILLGIGCSKEVEVPKKRKPMHTASHVEYVLTFDDAPGNPDNVKEMLKYLKRYKVTATFFCVGHLLRTEPELATRIAKEHTLANHTMTHSYLSKVDTWKWEVLECQKIVDSINLANNKPLNRYFRPPYGDLRKDQLEYLTSIGIKTVMWDVATEDWTKKSVSLMFSDIKSGVGNMLVGDIPIILMHFNPKSVKVIHWLLTKWSQNKRYSAISLDEYYTRDLIHQL